MSQKSAIERFEDEFLLEQGFFNRLHFRDFREDLAERALESLRATQIANNHADNYRLAHLLFGASVDIDGYARVALRKPPQQILNQFFDLISLRFEQIRALGESIRGQS
jgi:hypothetical protein